ncbi:uncharacterized protein LOC121979532 [Zingiber officinale]|uniref:uncharacterized protein LOC121979532 n=1 Tax=Zingiber officinale TaxID=94328 RepID=UPI001C4D6895|nr:uncharacterized protein LOC121979532 [Zingiber officinale]
MRGEFNGLQALIIKDCRGAYYVHCFAHRLQLALVATSKNVTPIHQFFDRLTFIVNIVGSSCKRNDELKNAHADDIAHLIAINELETGHGLNQMGTLQRAADTRWSSHLRSLKGLIKMFSASCTVLLKVMDDGLPSQRADATSVYEEMTSFDFVFILHLMNAMELVLSTKNLLQHMRDNKWNDLLAKVKSFCELRNIDIPDFNAPYIDRQGRARVRQDNFTIEHHYQVDLFYASIDSQLQEINGRFSDDAMEFLILSNALNPQNAMESFKIEDICKLVEKFYAQDFTKDEKEQLEMQLKHYEYNVVKGPNYKNLSTISELCQWLVKTNKSVTYNLIFRVIILVLTLPISTATTERSFSAMNIVKTRLRSKMEDTFLSDALMVYIEREIAKNLESLLTWKVEGLDSREFGFVTFTCSEEASVAICGMDGKLDRKRKNTRQLAAKSIDSSPFTCTPVVKRIPIDSTSAFWPTKRMPTTRDLTKFDQPRKSSVDLRFDSGDHGAVGASIATPKEGRAGTVRRHKTIDRSRQTRGYEIAADSSPSAVEMRELRGIR